MLNAFGKITNRFILITRKDLSLMAYQIIEVVRSSERKEVTYSYLCLGLARDDVGPDDLNVV